MAAHLIISSPNGNENGFDVQEVTLTIGNDIIAMDVHEKVRVFQSHEWASVQIVND